LKLDYVNPSVDMSYLPYHIKKNLVKPKILKKSKSLSVLAGSATFLGLSSVFERQPHPHRPGKRLEAGPENVQQVTP